MPTAKNFRVQPGSSADTYMVTGIVECPTGGWATVLVPNPSASTPTRPVLSVRVTKPSGIVTQAITPYEVARNISGSGLTEVVVELTGGVTTDDGATSLTLPIPA